MGDLGVLGNIIFTWAHKMDRNERFNLKEF